MKRILYLILAMCMISAVSALDTNNMYAYYTFDDEMTNRTAANDSTIYAQHAIQIGDIQNVAGKIGNANLYDGTINNITEVLLSTEFVEDSDWAFTAWVKLNQISGVYHSIASIYEDGLNWFEITTNNPPEYNLRFACRDDEGVSCDGGLSNGWNPTYTNLYIANNTWAFVTMSYDSDTNTLKMCIDGSCNSTSYTLGDVGMFYEFWFGYTPNSDYSIIGLLDEVGFWNETLEQSEIEYLYNYGEGCQYPFDSCGNFSNITSGIVGAWNFNGNVLDVSGNNHILHTNSNKFVPDWDGTANSSIYLNDDNTYTDGLITNLNQFTISTAIKINQSNPSYGWIFANGVISADLTNVTYLSLDDDATDELRYAINGSTKDVAGVLPSETWLLFTYVFNSTHTILYINGTYKDATAYNGKTGKTSLDVMSLGSLYGYTNTSVYPLRTSFDNFYVWNRVLSQSEINYIYNSGSPRELLDEVVTPIITIISPDDHEISNLPLDITYNTTQDGSCGVYIDGILNLTDANVENGTEQYFNVTLGADGTYHYYINCSISGSNYFSEERHYHYHAQSPLIDMFKPNHDNTTIFTNFNLDWIGNITNGNLTWINETIRNSTNDVVYSDLDQYVGASFFDLTKTINATLWGNGYYYYTIDAIDEVMNYEQEVILFQIDVCIPDWICSGYAACNTSNLQSCNAATDVNVCGLNYTGDLSEFPAQSCNYCTATASVSSTNLGNKTCRYDLTMTNWGSCCNVTQASSDCLYTFTSPAVTINFTSSDTAESYYECSAYVATYAVADLDNIFADGLGTAGAAVVAVVGIIVIGGLGVVTYRWLRR